MEQLTEREKMIFELAYERGYKDGHKDGDSGRMKISSIDREDPKRIIETCAAYLNIAYEAMYSKSRKRDIVYARHMTIALLAKFTKLSLKDIGKLFNGRDHTTVIHAKRSVEKWVSVEKETEHDFNYLSNAIQRVLINHEDIMIEPKKANQKQIWSDFYRDYQKQKRDAEVKIMKLAQEAMKVENQVTFFHRPKPEYTNLSGHIHLTKKLETI
jgi:hypothetical protein